MSKKNKYYYIFQVYGKKVDDFTVVDLTTVEVLAENYEEAIKQVLTLLENGDTRTIRLKEIVLEK